MVLGHRACGAVDAAIKSIRDGTTLPGHLPALVEAISPAIKEAIGKPGDALDDAIEANVRLNVERSRPRRRSSRRRLREEDQRGRRGLQSRGWAGGPFELSATRLGLRDQPRSKMRAGFAVIVPSWTLHPQLDATRSRRRACRCRACCSPGTPIIPGSPGAAPRGVERDDRSRRAGQAALTGEIAGSAGRSRRVTCDKLNVAALGNVVPQLHVHVIARRRDDPAWPKPIWGVAAGARL